ncbi:ABC transporter substrate-binding protein [Saxibacter everestensis]|uniref:ABC transporter substrate-binding protein n=1 Tax=Saxibacter everestensis TaxID=2909229 RepID=A0ABY8QRS0_9MICO|nr:ABC transporter substrate-binding protein [Brevibacteriaceae bacterium ZFBP1038]
MKATTEPRRWMRGIRIGAVVTVAALALAACGGGSEPSSGGSGETIPLRLVENNTNSSLAAVVADKKGFFADSGLDVKATAVADISKVPQTLGNQFDVGFGVEPLVIRGSVQGLDTVAIAGNGASSAEAPFMTLMAKADSGIKSAQDMAGKVLAGPTLTGTHHIATLYWLKKEGVDPSSVRSVQVATPAMIDQLEQGQIDVAELQEPYITEAKRRGLVEVAFSSGAVAPTTIESLWITTPDWADKNGEAIKRFRAALERSVEWMKDPANEDETKQILAEFTKQDPKLVDQAPLLEYRVKVTPEDLEVWGTAMKEVTDFNAEVDYDKLVYPWQ